MDLWGLLLAGLGVVVVCLVLLVLVATRRRSPRDLGSVSSQWIAEHVGKSL